MVDTLDKAAKANGPIIEAGEFEETVCFCHNVSRGELRTAIHAGARDLATIQNETLASTGCGGCECEVLDLLEEELALVSVHRSPDSTG